MECIDIGMQEFEKMKYNKVYLLREKHSWTNDDFLFFWGHEDRGKGLSKACLSQWWPCWFEVEGLYYNCTEQYMMAEKARLFGDDETRSMMMLEHNPMAIKKLGRRVRGYDDDVWRSARYGVVVKGNAAKFSQNEDLLQFLKGTAGKVLVEASPKDTVWGIGLDESHPDAINPARWHGENLLGFALMEVRDIIINKQ